METTQTNSSWDKKQEVIKGNRGEQIILDFLIQKGWIVYKAVTTGGHCFDMMATKDRKELRIIEVKTKAKRTKYPDTGINIKHYEEYKRIMERHNLKIFIAFVDEGMGKIYGHFLSELDLHREIRHEGRQLLYPRKENGIIYFPVESMVTIAALQKQDVDFLREHSTRSYEYGYA